MVMAVERTRGGEEEKVLFGLEGGLCKSIDRIKYGLSQFFSQLAIILVVQHWNKVSRLVYVNYVRDVWKDRAH